MAALVANPPVISLVSPSVGTPQQNNANRSFPATGIRIKGRNFSIGNTFVFFNGVSAKIDLNTGTEIFTSVPAGAESGFIYVRTGQGQCIPNTKLGLNCSGEIFFVDCYSPLNNEYGRELEVRPGQPLDIEFEGVQTRAIRALALATGSRVSITCGSVTTVRFFSTSCESNDLVLIRNPVLEMGTAKFMQFYLTAGDSTCSISVL